MFSICTHLRDPSRSTDGRDLILVCVDHYKLLTFASGFTRMMVKSIPQDRTIGIKSNRCVIPGYKLSLSKFHPNA